MDFEDLKEAKYYLEKSFPYELPRENIIKLIDAEIKRQTITDEDVQKAIEYLKPIARHPITANRKHLETAITALRQMKRGSE